MFLQILFLMVLVYFFQKLGTSFYFFCQPPTTSGTHWSSVWVTNLSKARYMVKLNLNFVDFKVEYGPYKAIINK